jgi:hypothetical protein
MFCINVGKFERLIRVFRFFDILYWSYFSIRGKLWGFIGLVPVITGILGWCPLYLPFKINTNK